MAEPRTATPSCPLERLPLSNRSLRRLRENGYRTAEQVAEASDEELLALPGFGETCLAEVRAALRRPPAPDHVAWPDPAVMDADRLERAVSELPIPNRARRVFERNGIATIGDLLRLGPSRLLALSGFGQASLRAVARAVAASALEEETPGWDERTSLPIERLDLPKRAARVLRRLDVRTVGDLARLDPRELLRHRNFGPASLRRLRAEVDRLRRQAPARHGALGDALEDLLSRLRPREREVVELREGVDPGGPLSLGTIGRRFGVTESRICQIEHAAWRKLRRFAPDHLSAFVGPLIEALAGAGGIAHPDDLDLSGPLDPGPYRPALPRLLARLLPHAVALLPDGKLAAAPAATVQTVVARLRKRLRRGGRSLPFDEVADEVLRGTGLGRPAREIVRCLLESAFGREVRPGPDGRLRIRTQPQGFLDDAERILAESSGPLHYAEIARRLALPPYHRLDADEERVRLRLCRDARFVLVERGRYDLRERVRFDPDARERWAEAALKELRRLGRPASAAVLRRLLAQKDVPTPPSESLVQRLLREDGRFAHVGRGTFAPKGAVRKVPRVSQLLERALREEGGPLPYAELCRRVQAQRKVSEGSISATLVSRDLFLRTARGVFDLSERHPFPPAARRRLASWAERAIEERGGVASLEDLAALADWPEQATVRSAVLLGDLLRRTGRFRLVRGGFVTLADGRLEERLRGAARREIAAAGRALGAAEVARRLRLGKGARQVLREALRAEPAFPTDERGRFRCPASDADH